MSIFKREKAQPAQAAVAEVHSEHEFDELSSVASALEKEIENDPAAKAALELEGMELSPGAKSLLDRALDNLSKNKGENLPDADAKVVARLRSDLIEAAGNDLGLVLDVLVDSCGKPQEISGVVYSTCFNIVKAATFIANLDYRRYLDPRAEFDLSIYTGSKGEDGVDERDGGRHGAADLREEDQDHAPIGLDTPLDRELALLKSLYGEHIEDASEVFAQSLSDLRLFMQLTAESFGWDPNAGMPFMFVQEANGSFTPISDVHTALDVSEVKRKESQRRRREQEALRLVAAADKARAILKARLAR